MSVESVQVEDSEEDGGRGSDEGEGGITDSPPRVLAVAALFALLIGGISAYASMNLSTAASAVVAVVMGAGSGYHLAGKPTPAYAAGSGSYITAIILIITPFALYLPDIVLRDEEIRIFAEDVAASDVTIGGDVLFDAGALSIGGLSQGNVDGLLQLIVWVVVFMLIALGLFVLGKVLKTVGKEKKGGKKKTKMG